MSASHSAQDMVRAGDATDLYYYDHETSKKQCWPTTVNTKYVQQFNNLSGGSSVFTIPPQQGVQDVVCSFALGSLDAADGLALNRGWGYQLIKQVSYRYGGSSQYFLTGDQILQNALRAQPSREAASDILLLGGSAALPGDLTSKTQFASVVLTLPHATPSGVGKAHPFPSDCLTQQIQITVELNPVSSMFSVSGEAPSAVPTSLDSATFQVQQVMLNNAGDALARRVDLSLNAYAFPAEFVQQKQTIPLTTSGENSVVLTGFRSGEVKAIHCWLNRASDMTGPIKNPWNWVLPLKVEMQYAGDVYARYEGNSSTLWNMINGDKYPGAQSIALTYAGATYSGTSQVSTWVELPFAQPFVDEDSHYTLVHGKPITNGIVNLTVTPPYSAGDWLLNVSYIYNTTLLFSQGTVDYVF